MAAPQPPWTSIRWAICRKRPRWGEFSGGYENQGKWDGNPRIYVGFQGFIWDFKDLYTGILWYSMDFYGLYWISMIDPLVIWHGHSEFPLKKVILHSYVKVYGISMIDMEFLMDCSGSNDMSWYGIVCWNDDLYWDWYMILSEKYLIQKGCKHGK